MRAAIPVLGLHMLNLRLFEFEKPVAIPAVMVIATCHVVLSLGVEAPEVGVAVIANPVSTGIFFVLLQGLVVLE